MSVKSKRGRRLAIGTVLGALCLAVAGSAPAAQAASPAFSIRSFSTPSHLASPDSTGVTTIFVVVKNIGGATTDGSQITVTDMLPLGLSVTGQLRLFADRFEGAVGGHCEAGPPVTCTSPDSAGPITGQPYLRPDDLAVMEIPKLEVAGGLDGTTLTNQVTVSGGGAASTSATTEIPVSSTPAPFGFQESQVGLSEADGTAATQAGSHPFRFNTTFLLNGKQFPESVQSSAPLKDVTVKLPRGLIVNPQATARCTEAQLESNNGVAPLCPDASVVGMAYADINPFASVAGTPSFTSSVYNLVPPPGVPAELGMEFSAGGNEAFVHIRGGVDGAGDYELTAESSDLTQFADPTGIDLDLWGSPSDPSHDYRRGECSTTHGGVYDQRCRVEPPGDTPFMTMPSACSGPLQATFAADSWTDPGNFASATAQTADAFGTPVGVNGCSALAFAPTLKARPTTNLADSPSGLSVDLHVPQTDSLGELASANLRKTVVTLPEGLVVNPSGANGLDACSSAQIGLTTPVGQAPVHFAATHPGCPDASRVGTVQVTTPLLEDPLSGSVYIARPFDNPFGSMLALYVVIDDPQSGLIFKLPGEIEPDPQTGRLLTSFDENPELPFSDFELQFKGGPHGVLSTPETCGAYSTTSSLTPWSGTAPATPHDDYSISQGPGGTCHTSLGQEPNSPAFDAGTVSPVAASFSPFVVNLSREDGSQRFSKVTISPPPGLLAKLAGVSECTDAQLAQAEARSHPGEAAAELAAPSCPAASRVGSVDVAAGTGPSPYHAPGTVYLAGPYRGAPYSLAILTPATAGPFDLGVVVVRTALHVDPATAQITAVSDPLPAILGGIPLDLRSAQIKLDRPDFTLNGTSCDRTSIGGSLGSTQGFLAPLSDPFQLGECAGLPFKPQLSLEFKGSTRRTANPRLIATVRAKPGEANIAMAQVKLPKAAFLDNSHIGTVCTRVQFAADQCPTDSVYGQASATSPLLDYPLTGNVYLRSSDHPLPDLVVALRGPATQPVAIDLIGRTDSVKGALRNTFEAAPDAPVSSFRLELFGGKKGLIELSDGLCANRYATVLMNGQNGKTHDTRPLVKASCPKMRRHHSGGHRHRG